ncbi:hypothetical protein [Sulfobacillus harzensis]|uniref:Uncharacterized protein n=1 Tax=Sulfobacillus harzensis TaxID=2729629 RepID=A0A7Y0Q265_9FIRM|nr:hypothetical protein [Sulfobacillus harzensis]NMP22157.1 hypothetical protein [Sulfobacillus harzensis]
MDPQRQYAQLLTLWSEGSKLFRRQKHYRSRKDDRWDGWWRLGRRMVERGLSVLPVPLASPMLVAAVGERWFTIAGLSDVEKGIARDPVIILRHRAEAALHWDGRWSLHHDLALRLGPKGWRMLLEWPRPGCCEILTVSSVEASLTLIGAVGRHPAMFKELPLADWELASQMLRHPGRRFPASHPLPVELGFRFDRHREEAWYQGQDEDSVQCASRSSGGGTPGGRGINV